MMEVKKGQIVYFVLPSGKSEGQTRAAVVTNVFTDTQVNLEIFLDGINDSGSDKRAYSVKYSPDKTLNTWHLDTE